MNHYQITTDGELFIEDYLAPSIHAAYEELSAAISERGTKYELKITQIDVLETI